LNFFNDMTLSLQVQFIPNESLPTNCRQKAGQRAHGGVGLASCALQLSSDPCMKSAIRSIAPPARMRAAATRPGKIDGRIAISVPRGWSVERETSVIVAAPDSVHPVKSNGFADLVQAIFLRAFTQ
jgi:hypothetical protein